MTSASLAFGIQVPAAPCHLKAIRDFFSHVFAEAQATEPDNLLLAVDEACANVIRHRCPSVCDGALYVQAEVRSEQIHLRIANYCQASDLPAIKPRDLNDVRPGGLGTSFIASIMDRVSYEREPTSNGAMALIMQRALRP